MNQPKKPFKTPNKPLFFSRTLFDSFAIIAQEMLIGYWSGRLITFFSNLLCPCFAEPMPEYNLVLEKTPEFGKVGIQKRGKRNVNLSLSSLSKVKFNLLVFL